MTIVMHGTANTAFRVWPCPLNTQHRKDVGTMEAGIRIIGDEVFTPGGDSDEMEIGVAGLDSVHVSGPGEAETNGDEYVGARWECSLCGERFTDDDDTRTQGYCDQSDEDEMYHKLAPIPVSWLNSAAVHIDTDDDTVTVRISVGDPRGAFVMQVERLQYTDNATGEERDELRLHVPHPEEGMPHMKLEPLASPGYYRIGD